MKNHIEPIDVGKKPLICKTCDIKFEIEASLVNHLKLDHEGKELFKCPIKYPSLFITSYFIFTHNTL